MTALNTSVMSIELIEQFSKNDLENHIDETRLVMMKQMREDQDRFVCSSMANVDELEKLRMGAMKKIIEDFELGKNQGRYLTHQLHNQLSFDENSFE